MQIILREDLKNLGQAGDLVEVKPGYGRNYLIPQGLAMVATADNIQKIEHEKRLIAAKKAKLLKDAQAIIDRLKTVSVTVTRQVGEDDKLFGSVTSRDIEEQLAQKGITVDHKKIVIAETIKTAGEHTVEIKLGHGLSAPLVVSVISK